MTRFKCGKISMHQAAADPGTAGATALSGSHTGIPGLLPGLVLAMVALLASHNTHGAEQLQESQQRLLAIESAIAELEDWLQGANTSLNEQQLALRQVESDYGRVTTEAAKLEQEVARQRAELRELDERQQQLQRDHRQLQSSLQALVRSAYVTGQNRQGSFLKTLFTLDGAASLSRQQHYQRTLTAGLADRAGDLSSTLLSVEQVSATLQQTLADLNRQQVELADRMLALEALQQQRDAAIADLQAQISGSEGELAGLRADQAALGELVEQLESVLQRVPPGADSSSFDARQGDLFYPLQGRVTSAFGSRYGNGSLTRQGIFIAADPGTPVQAVHGGTVVFADWLRGAGLLVVVNHGEGFMTLYGGNQSLAVSPGEQVRAGDVIASSGYSPERDSTGLYFEIREEGQAVNPARWLSQDRAN